MTRTVAALSMLVLSMSYSERSAPAAMPASRPPAPAVQTPSATAVPPAVDGWREYPLREGVISIRPAKWRTDSIEVPVPPGKGLEYKLTMRKGETLVYNVSYVGLADPGKLISEFHGHTKQVDGVGDLMFYSKTNGLPESGSFTAPWDGIHGWYLKNDSGSKVVAKLELAGFYELESK